MVQTMKFNIVGFLHSPVSSLLGTNIRLMILFSNTLDLHFEYDARKLIHINHMNIKQYVSIVISYFKLFLYTFYNFL
jgi:hypothetical protein